MVSQSAQVFVRTLAATRPSKWGWGRISSHESARSVQFFILIILSAFYNFLTRFWRPFCSWMIYRDAAGNRKIEIILPDLPDLPAVPTNYTLDVRNPASTNLYVFDELSKPEVVGTTTVKNEMPASGSANNQLNKLRRPRPKVARWSISLAFAHRSSWSLSLDVGSIWKHICIGRPRVTGKIMHECLVSPVINDSYRAVMRARQQKASQPKRTIKRVNEDVGTLNRMASGISTQVQANKFAAFTVSPFNKS